LYNIFISLFKIGISITGIWNTKAKQWVRGRKNIWKELEQKISKNDHIIWIHSSSVGEFEQAKPLIEELKKEYPAYKILASFFSPSGYHASKNYKHADYIFYLPIDTAGNARRFIQTVDPRLVVFVKYDFWYHYLQTIHNNKIPLLLISAVFNKRQVFFKWYGALYKKILFFFSQVFVQDEASLAILQEHGIKKSQLSGDTRFDRVAIIASSVQEIAFIKDFISDKEVIVAGSTWPGDETLLKGIRNSIKIKLIIAPHEIHDHRIKSLQQEFEGALLYSQLKNDSDAFNADFLIIDNVGMLSRLYHYATIAFVGGGFTKDGIHNILEAAVHAKPVVFGPNHEKYGEAKELILHGGGFSISTPAQLKNLIEKLLEDKNLYQKVCEKSVAYTNSKKGATQKIMTYIQENRLLTN
jgi:3-deoxy-D-manno-octulosonic-acid transferase